MSGATPIKFERKTVWYARGENFLVEVMCRKMEDRDHRGGPWRWNVYAYVYPGHVRFDKIKPPTSSLCAPEGTGDLHFHGGILGGITFFLTHRGDDGQITSYQFGADYDHLHDDWARELPCPDEGWANSVFFDAERLYRQLTPEGATR